MTTDAQATQWGIDQAFATPIHQRLEHAGVDDAERATIGQAIMHIVIDTDVLDALIAAGDAQSSALNNLGCRCQHDTLYAPHTVTHECAKHASSKAWTAAKAKAEAAKAAAA